MSSDRFLHRHEEAEDDALLHATRVGMLAERVGLPLLPWQQQVIDRMCVADATTTNKEADHG